MLKLSKEEVLSLLGFRLHYSESDTGFMKIAEAKSISDLQVAGGESNEDTARPQGSAAVALAML